MIMPASLFNRIKADEIADRLDGEYYSRELLENENKLGRFNQVTLESSVTNSRNAISDLTSNGSFEFLRGIQFNDSNGIPYIRTQNLMEGYIDSTDVIYVDLKCKEMVAKSICETGDLVVCRKGKVGAASAVSVEMNGAAISENVTRFRLQGIYDGDFLAAFLNSNHGRMRFLREATGVIQKWINNEKLRQIKVIRIEPQAEKYIGDKVRQAEQLRAWARRLECSIDCLLTTNNDYLLACRTPETKSSRPQLNDLSNRLDPKYYGNKAIAVQRFARKKGVILGDLIKSVANGFEERSFLKSGLAYITVSEVSSGRLNAQAAPKISKSVDVPSKAIIHESCVLVVRTGSIGTAVKVHELDKGCAISSHLIRLEFNDEETAAAVAVFLNSAAGKVLLHKISYGAVQPQIGQEELLALSIPEYVLNDKAKCLSLLNSYELAVRASANLTTAAKTLVEALIEGQLTEQQLIQAQQALEDGDNSLDQAILSKLSSEGYAIEGTAPLFSNVEELYRLLESAAEAEE
ncbi:hypothetical protein [Thiopseudomonas alkaliphila]|uniref:hypothetical protein n=1 Tax=Thiopseudomonas alkaliphila TaxID=1697053 RepID=UPI00191C05E5|nr:hypothetical protein [Thiopseudomonas alkaliphila]